ncbi:MAG: hypothetical protein SNG10_03085 [Rikenellaceae bacterium]
MATSRSSIGGVFSVVMWLCEDSGRSDPPTSLDGDITSIRVPIISSKSSYSETTEIDGGICHVTHTLTITTTNETFWSNKALRGAETVGCIAEVEISSLGKILLGWSSRLGYDQPLRLTKTTVESSSSVNEGCTKSWVFKSYSTQPLI